MNYLAHFYLSKEDENLILGNLIADSVKGSISSESFKDYNENIILGIKLHRVIDSFTDTHHVVRRSTKRLQPKYHKYAGVLVDMYYDHVLAKNWNMYSDEPLELYSARVYQVLDKNKKIIPTHMSKLVNSMTSRDWLSNYRFQENLQWAFEGLARRTKFDSKIEQGLDDLLIDYGKFQDDFFEFFPQLITHCNEFLKLNNHDTRL